MDHRVDPFLTELARSGPWALMTGFLIIWIRELVKTQAELLRALTVAITELKTVVANNDNMDRERWQQLLVTIEDLKRKRG